MSALDRFVGRAAPVSPAAPPGLEPCQACGSTAMPTERRKIDGYDIVVCQSASPCIAWAKTAGRWEGKR